VPRRWKLSEKPKFDYGVVVLDTNVGNTVGWFGFATEADDFLTRRKIKVRGYPGDKPFGTMWSMGAKIKNVTDTALFYGLDTAGGQSGSPAFGSATGCDPCVFGIHAYGNAPPDIPFNSATRITSTVFDFLAQAGTN
jgi:glutamyl endopeptidase